MRESLPGAMKEPNALDEPVTTTLRSTSEPTSSRRMNNDRADEFPDDTSTLNQDPKSEKDEAAAKQPAKIHVAYMKGIWPVPHITVLYNGQKMAFSRKDLRNGGYKGAQCTLFKNLLVGTNGLHASDVKTHAQNIRIYAHFYSTRGGVDEELMLLPPESSKSGWRRLIDNVIVLKVEYNE